MRWADGDAERTIGRRLKKKNGTHRERPLHQLGPRGILGDERGPGHGRFGLEQPGEVVRGADGSEGESHLSRG